jgi:hypothetical protein
MDGAALEDLRWYVEDYLGVPYRVYEARDPRLPDGSAAGAKR